MIDTEKARELMKDGFPFTERCTQYIARYNTKTGKEIALERDRTEAFFVWIQKYEAEIEGVVIKNEKFPGLPYERTQSRNSNLNETNTPRLKKGNKVWYLQIDSLSSLKKLVDWYANQ